MARTRRLVASSGIAAALLAVSPVAAAIADEVATEPGADSSILSAPEPTEATPPDPAPEEPEPKDELDEDAALVDAPVADEAGTLPIRGDSEAKDVEPSPAETPDTGVPSVPVLTAPQPPLRDPVAPGDAPADSSNTPAPKSPTATATTTDDEAEPGADATASVGVTPASQLTAPVVTVAEAVDDFLQAPVGDGLFYRLVNGPGPEGLILWNQGLAAFAVLNWRARGDGRDRLGLLGAGEKLFVPAHTVAELSLGKHAWDSEADDTALDSSVLQTFLDRSVVTLAGDQLVSFSDPDDRFLDPTDAEYTSGAGPEPIWATAPPGVTYSVPDNPADGVFTIHNNSDQDIAIHDIYDFEGSSLVVVHSGGSYTVPDNGDGGVFLGTDMYRIQTERQGGVPVFIGVVQSDTRSGLVSVVAPATQAGSAGIPLAEWSMPDFAVIDPENRFPRFSQTSQPVRVPADPIEAGISYSVAEDETVTIRNEGTRDVVVVQVGMGGQVYSYDIVESGGGARDFAPVPGGGMLYVLGELQEDGSSPDYGSILDYPRYAPTSQPADATVSPIPLGVGAANHAPVGTATVGQPDPTTGSVIVTPAFTDADGDPLTYVATAIRGTVTDNNDGTFTYRPNTGQAHAGGHVDTVVVTATDGRGGSRAVAIEVPVAAQNASPTGNYVIAHQPDGSYTLTPVFTDPDGDALTYQIVGQPSFGSTSIGAGGVITYRADPDKAHAAGYQDELTVRVSDGHGSIVDHVVPVSVAQENTAPTGTYGPAQPGPNGTRVLTPSFQDADGDALSYRIVTMPTYGSASIDENGFISYAPDADRAHESAYADEMVVAVDDGHGGVTLTTANVQVAQQNQRPVITVNKLRTEPNGGATYTVTLTDPDGDPVTYTVSAEHGSVTINDDGTFTYLPDLDYAHDIEFTAFTEKLTLRADDDHGGVTTSVETLSVPRYNNAPTLEVVLLESGSDGSFTYSAHGADADGDALTYSVLGYSTHGVVTKNADGTFTYRPDAAENGYVRANDDSFRIVVEDERGGSTSRTIDVHIEERLDPLSQWWQNHDPDNRFLTYDDFNNDWPTTNPEVAPDGKQYWDVSLSADPRWWGVSYTPSGDGTSVTIHNDGLEPIAVTHSTITENPNPSQTTLIHHGSGYFYNPSENIESVNFVIIEPGQSHTFATTAPSVLDVQAPRDVDGTPKILGTIYADPADADSYGYVDNAGLGAIRSPHSVWTDPATGAGVFAPGIPDTKWAQIDPRNQFWDPGDRFEPYTPDAGYFGEVFQGRFHEVWAEVDADPVQYERVGSSTVIYNKTDHDIMVMNTTTWETIVIAPGSAGAVSDGPGGYRLIVQGPRQSGQPVLLAEGRVFPGLHNGAGLVEGRNLAPIGDSSTAPSDPFGLSNPNSPLGQILSWVDSLPPEFTAVQLFTEFFTDHATAFVTQLDKARQVGPIKQVFDSLPDFQKQSLFQTFADVADGKIKLAPPSSLTTMIDAITKISPILDLPQVLLAIREQHNADTPEEELYANISTAAALFPYFAAAVGFVAIGPGGAAMGYSAGSALGLGLEIGAAISRNGVVDFIPGIADV